MAERSRSKRERLIRGIVRGVGRLPDPAKRLLAGKPIVVDGQEMNVEAQIGMRMLALGGSETFETLPLDQGRAQIEDEAWMFGYELPVETVTDLVIPGPAGPIPARLYRPAGVRTPSPGLVYLHGGGRVLGGLHSGDSVSRYLADGAGITVVSIDYRLAPEHPFPAAVEDSLAAFRHVVEHADRFGVDPAAVAVGGESAGGNLAAVVSLEAARAHAADPSSPVPVFQLLFMPVTDLSTKHASYQTFGTGYFLTEAQMDWYKERYLADPGAATDPRVSPLLAEDVSATPPAYVAVAGYDPLRDEGEAYAAKLAAAGVPVTSRRHGGIYHGLINATGVGRAARDALDEAVAALSTALHDEAPGAR